MMTASQHGLAGLRFVVRLGAVAILSAALLALPELYGSADLPDAHAHGGRIKPKPPKPGGGGPVPPFRQPGFDDPRPPPPPPAKLPKPITPGGSGPTPVGKPKPTTRKPPIPTTPPSEKPRRPTTGQDSGRPTRRSRPGRKGGAAASAAPETTWEMWWDLNRWTWFPERSTTWAEPKGVVTPRAEGEPPLDREALARERRLLVVRQHIVPFLLKQLDPKVSVRPEVRAAAMIALGKVSHEPAVVALIRKHATDRRAANVVRESAAYALGMLRRSETAQRMDGARLDEVRTALLDLVDDEKAPVRTRSFAAFSIGLLGDQPYGSPFTKDGRVMSRALWERAQRKYSARDIPVAVLTALGMQPAAGTGEPIKEGLRRVVQGRRVAKRRWSAFERSHALCALVRQRADGWTMTLFRTLGDKRLPVDVRRAAFIALGKASDALDAEDREEAAKTTSKAIRLARDGLTRGLGQITLGRLLAADLAAGSATLVTRSAAPAALLSEARHGALPHRGFSALSLALAMRGASSKIPESAKFHADGLAALERGFERTKDPVLRSAYAAALGVVGKPARRCVEALTVVLTDRGTDVTLRSRVALALAQMGADQSDVRKALRTALWDKRSVALRSQAGLALSFLGGSAETKMLIRELRTAKSRWVLSQVAAALGQLGDLDAVPAVLALASDASREDEPRALAIASLGLLGDPEPKPSTLRLTSDANYPARTDSLLEAFTML